jgi:hypothetical protein
MYEFGAEVVEIGLDDYGFSPGRVVTAVRMFAVFTSQKAHILFLLTSGL